MQAQRKHPSHSGSAVILMYHALRRGEAAPQGQEPGYTVGFGTFAAQLDLAQSIGPVGSARDWLCEHRDLSILVGFDDGHVSNYTDALPLLQARSITADFFINPASVGTPGFLDWAQLREMAGLGMSIQSHGWDHRFFNDYSAAALRQSLRAARETIEDRVGTAVTLLAPPGGRMHADMESIAIECGYRHVLNSKPGVVRSRIDSELPRMAVMASTSISRFEAWCRQDPTAIGRERLRYEVLAFAKRALGAKHYARLRGGLVQGAGGVP